MYCTTRSWKMCQQVPGQFQLASNWPGSSEWGEQWYGVPCEHRHEFNYFGKIFQGQRACENALYSEAMKNAKKYGKTLNILAYV